MWPFKSKEQKEKERQKRLDDIVAVGPGNTNGYYKYCPNCGRNFSYWYANFSKKLCPGCAHLVWDYGEIMVATVSSKTPNYSDAVFKLRQSKLYDKLGE